jgi:hypothetical protein
MFNGSAILSHSRAQSTSFIIDNSEKGLRLRFNIMSTYMRNGDEQKGEVQRDTSTNHWRELGGDDKQETNNTLTKEIHW